MIFYITCSTLLTFLAKKSNIASTKLPVASTLLLVWMGLKMVCELRSYSWPPAPTKMLL